MTAPDRGIPADFDPADLRTPPRWALLGELRAPMERLSLALARKRLIAEAPKGNGEPVMVVPGVFTDDSWTRHLRAFLTDIGYRAVGWGLGRNRGNVPKLIPQVGEVVERFADARGSPVRMVGWSLGGYLAREAARDRPHCVERVVTLGAPIVGGPSYTASAPGYVRRGYDLDEIKAAVLEREETPIRVPVFAVYSRSDGVVQWQSCIDTFQNPRVEHHEVEASHLGLVSSPRVFRLVAELLARPLDTT
jgi:pimeloyl-ACP methyl ester carboxylesterase